MVRSRMHGCRSDLPGVETIDRTKGGSSSCLYLLLSSGNWGVDTHHSGSSVESVATYAFVWRSAAGTRSDLGRQSAPSPQEISVRLPSSGCDAVGVEYFGVFGCVHSLSKRARTNPCANLRFYTRSSPNSDCACALRTPTCISMGSVVN